MAHRPDLLTCFGQRLNISSSCTVVDRGGGENIVFSLNSFQFEVFRSLFAWGGVLKIQ